MMNRPKTSTLLFFLSSMAAISSADSNQNGRCDEEFCACTLTVPVTAGVDPSCPDWMVTTGEGGPYDTVASGSTIPTAGTGIIACDASKNVFFVNFGNSTVNLVSTTDPDDPSNETSIAYVSSWYVLDGNETVVVNYTEADPAPECPFEAPFTASPTMAPTVTMTPTTGPTIDSGAASTSQLFSRGYTSAALSGVLFGVALLFH
jgi:hypothetical protein